MTTVLVIGEYYSDNLGDPLLCEVVTNIIKEEYPGIEVIPFDISGKINMQDYFSVDKNSKSEIRKRKKRRYIRKIPFVQLKEKKQIPNSETINSLKEILKHHHIDLAIFAGGEMFMDYFAQKIFITVKLLRKTKIIFHACGMHEISEKSKKLFQTIFRKNNVVSISVRDSYKRFIDIFGEKKLVETYDTALLCSQYFMGTYEKKTEYGIGVICREELFDFQIKLIQYFIKNNLDWQLFTNGNLFDYKFALKLLNAVGMKDNEITYRLHKRPRCSKELVEQITKYNKIVSFRMHSQIVAVSFGIPSFGFVWDNKVKEFYDKLGYSDNYSHLTGDINFKLILKKLDVDKQMLSKQAFLQGNLSKECLLNGIKCVFDIVD